MARIRTVKPEFWSSPDTAACKDPWERLLFVAMWNWADDAGRGTANPKELAGFAFPNDDNIDSADVRRMLGGIRRAFGVILYEVDGRPYYAIPSWEKHQKIDKRSAGKFPPPDAGTTWNPDPDQPKHQDSEKPADSPPESRRTDGAGTGEQGNRGTTTSAADADASAESGKPKKTSKAKPDRTPDPGFEEFWGEWPRKIAKDAARVKYRSALNKGVEPAEILTAARHQVAAWKAEGKEVRYIPHAATWLHQGRYREALERFGLRLVSDSDSPWAGYRSTGTESPWAQDMGRG